MEPNKKTLRNIFLGVAGCILLYWLLHETDRMMSILAGGWKVLAPFVAGAAVAFILNVPMRALERGLKFIKQDGLRRAAAIVLTLILVVLVLAGVIYLLVPQLITTIESLVEKLPAFFNNVYEKVNGFLLANPEILEWVYANTEFESLDWPALVEKAVAFISNSLTTILYRILTAVVDLSNGVFNAVVALVFALYCLARKEILARQGRRLLYAFLPEKFCDIAIRILRLTNSSFSNFISGQCLEALILGCMFAIAMLIFNMPYIPLVSVVIAVTALVPIVGAFVGCAVGAFFILVNDPVLAFWFVIMFLVIQQIEGNLIYPRVVGSSIGLPGMWVLVAVAVGGDLMGVGGMLVMIPLASVLYTLAREITAKRLELRGIDSQKLQAHPPELVSKFKENRQKKKQKKQQKKQETQQPVTADQEPESNG